MKIKKNSNSVIYYNQIMENLFPYEVLSKNTSYGSDENGNYIVTGIKIFYDVFFKENEHPIFFHSGLYIKIDNIIEGDKEDIVELTVVNNKGFWTLPTEFENILKQYEKIN